MFLVDTNIISELRKGQRCNVGVATWYTAVTADELFISALTLGEIRKGIELLRQRSDVEQASIYERWMEEVIQRFLQRILPIDSNVANAWGVMNAVRPVPIVDGLLAATAKVHNKILVTRNISDVEGLGVELLNPFDDSV